MKASRPEMSIVTRCVDRSDTACFDDVAADLFDHPIDRDLLDEFLRDPRHHMAIAEEDGRMVGFASAVHYVHPDKPPELWINEVGVAVSHRRQGLGKAIISCLLDEGRKLGCKEAWVLTDESNDVARALYRSAGGEESGPIIMASFDL